MPKSLPCCHFLFFLQTSIITHGEIGQWGRQKLSRAKGTSSYELVCRITIPEFGHGPQFPTNTLVERWTMLNLQASGTSSSSWSPSKISKGPSLLGIWCQRGWKTAQSIELVGPCCAMVPCKLSLQLRFWSATKKNLARFCSNLEFLWRLEFWIRKRGMSNVVAMATSILPLLLVVCRVACEFLRFICILTNQPI